MSTSTLSLTSYLASFVLLCHRSRFISVSVELTANHIGLSKRILKQKYIIKIQPRNGVMSDKKYKQADLSNYFKTSSSKNTSRKRKHSCSDSEGMSHLPLYSSKLKNARDDQNKASFQRNNSSQNTFTSQSSQDFPPLSSGTTSAESQHSLSSMTIASQSSRSPSEGPSFRTWSKTNRSDSNSSSSETTLDNYSCSSSEDIGAKEKRENKQSPDCFDQKRKSSSSDSSSSQEDYLDDKENHSRNKKGNSSKNFDRDEKPNADSAKLKPLQNSEDHVVLCSLEVSGDYIERIIQNSSLKGNDHSKRHEVNRNEFYFVILPCDYNPENKSPLGNSRWDIMQTKLHQSIPSVFELEDVILSYNERFKHTWNFDTLKTFFEEYMEDDERDNFFLKTLPKIITLALRVETLFPKSIPILKQNKSMKITMTQEQAACLLANAFLCTFPHRRFNKKGAGLPDINFSNLYSESGADRKIQKLKCLIHYFERVTTKMPKGRLTFSRQCTRSHPNWKDSTCQFTRMKVIEKGSIEDEGDGMLQADFANKFVGGGVLGKGLVQEEIRFIICPEMIVSRLFTEVLDDQEVLIMTGCERFSNYSGYSDTFKFTGNYTDKTHRDSWGRRMVDVVAMDALVIRSPKEQFKSYQLNRELKKAYCAFNNDYRTRELSLLGKPSPVCTGNWGCGAFRGDKQLKAVIQMMAASVADRDIYYCTFGDAEFSKDLKDVYDVLKEYNITVKKMMQWISEYEEKIYFLKSSLFHYIFKKTGRGGSKDSD